MHALSLLADWPVDNLSVGIVAPDGSLTLAGDEHRRYRIASLAKMIVGYTALVAVEEGIVSLDTPWGQPGCTLRHLLSHAGGYAFDGDPPVTRPGARRTYSNTGIELAAACIEHAAQMPYERYQREAVLEPLGMGESDLHGTPAHQFTSTVHDLALLMREWADPTLVTAASRDEFRTPQFADIAGIIPGLGRFDPCPWGLGCEIRGTKSPHWTGTIASPSAYGHFGGAGTFLLMEPTAGIGIVALTDRRFDDWASDALRLWPQFIDAVLTETASA
ncbi:MAG: hypothetical protein RJB65_928 [Actinomycetota bacterium]